MLALPGTSAIDEYVPMRGYFDVGDGPAPVVIGDRAASLAKLALIMCAVSEGSMPQLCRPFYLVDCDCE